MQSASELLALLNRNGQGHLVRFWDDLSETERQSLENQLSEIDFPLMQRLIDQRDQQANATQATDDRADRATSPTDLVRVPQTDADRERDAKARTIGEQLLKQGKVAAILVAGGQGSRLGFDSPKGMFPIGPVSDRTLFQVFCEQLLARSRKAGTAIPYFIMTSEATHQPTIAFFERHRYFGLPEDDVYFFQQASLPAVSDKTPEILLEWTDRVATSPDGHGGILRALEKQGMLTVMQNRGIEHLYYHQVDNPTAIVCDPVLLGHHLQTGSEMTTKVVAKVSPDEKMGVAVSVDGRTEIIEYSDLTPEQVRRADDNGNPIFWAGSTAIHVFRRDFLERLLADELSLPFHIAHKKVACIDATGEPIEPNSPNAHKFEQFIFDALPHAKVALVVEADRQREFNPVKNAEGNDSPQTSRAALARNARNWISAAGGDVAENAVVEISPLVACDPEDLRGRISSGQRFTESTVLNPQD